METFYALLAICAGNSPVSGEFPAQRPVTRSFDFFFDLCLNKRLSKQSWCWWFETQSCLLWRHCNAVKNNILQNRRDTSKHSFPLRSKRYEFSTLKGSACLPLMLNYIQTIPQTEVWLSRVHIWQVTYNIWLSSFPGFDIFRSEQYCRYDHIFKSVFLFENLCSLFQIRMTTK